MMPQRGERENKVKYLIRGYQSRIEAAGNTIFIRVAAS